MMLNFDCGHYLGSTGKDPRDFIEKYHNRIFSLHLKDKTGPKADPANFNQVWGMKLSNELLSQGLHHMVNDIVDTVDMVQ